MLYPFSYCWCKLSIEEIYELVAKTYGEIFEKYDSVETIEYYGLYNKHFCLV